MNNFEDWCEQAVSQIRYKPDRLAAFQELKDHLEDHYEALRSQGCSPEEARALALEAMGSPQDIAPQLGEIHRPLPGYAYSITKWIAIVYCCWAIFCLVAFVGSHIHATLSTYNYDSLRSEGEGGWYGKPRVSDRSDGYTFRISEAAIPAAGDVLYVELQSTHWPWMQRPEITSQFYALDSLGNRYASRAEAGFDEVPKVSWDGGFWSQGFSSEHLEITGFDSSAEWVELRYDRDGREIVLRIDLTGGEQE